MIEALVGGFLGGMLALLLVSAVRRARFVWRLYCPPLESVYCVSSAVLSAPPGKIGEAVIDIGRHASGLSLVVSDRSAAASWLIGSIWIDDATLMAGGPVPAMALTFGGRPLVGYRGRVVRVSATNLNDPSGELHLAVKHSASRRVPFKRRLLAFPGELLRELRGRSPSDDDVEDLVEDLDALGWVKK